MPERDRPSSNPPKMDIDDQRLLRNRAMRQLPPRATPAASGAATNEATSKAPTEAEQYAARTGRMLHELEVREIELAMQNEELRGARADEASALRCYADLFDHAPVGYVTLDHEGRIEMANLLAATMLGGTPAAQVGRAFATCLADDSRPALRAALDAASARPGTAVCEVRLRHDAALTLRLEVRADPSGSNLLMALIDLSALKRSEAAELELRLLQEKERLRSELLSRFSHELRTPLNAINGFAELLLDGKVPLERIEQRQMVQHILDAGQQLLRQVEHVLAMPR
jgi:PAS domain S-box-containing protein